MTLDQTFTPLILRFDTLPSTNTEALSQARQGAAEGVCVIAREQTAGRGRQDRTWNSPRDAGLYLSIVLRPRLPANQWPLLTLMAAVAVHESLKDVFGLVTDIKWPNDLMAGEKKLAGILAETTDSSGGRAAVVGVGVNLNPAAVFPELSASATSVTTETSALPIMKTGTNEFATALIRGIGRWYSVLLGVEGPARIVSAWSERSSYAEGKTVAVITGGETLSGTTEGVTEAGALRVRTEGGELRVLHSAEVTHLRRGSDE
jgi:BirA family biotin operon repressor/biotin-[acetyl-CoA-carboxylase] ligase